MSEKKETNEETGKIEDLPQVTLVYAGLVQVKNDLVKPLAHKWIEIDIKENDGRRLTAAKNYRSYALKRGANIVKLAGIGSIYTFPENEEGDLFPDRGEPVGLWKNKPQLNEWYAATRALRDARTYLLKAKKEARRDLVAETLEPMRRAYARSTPAARRAMLARVIEVITRPSY